jgi:hypothetical protein
MVGTRVGSAEVASKSVAGEFRVKWQDQRQPAFLRVGIYHNSGRKSIRSPYEAFSECIQLPTWHVSRLRQIARGNQTLLTAR